MRYASFISRCLRWFHSGNSALLFVFLLIGCILTRRTLCPERGGAWERSVQLPGAVLLGLQVINEKRDWTVWSLSYQFGHQLLQDQSKAESSWMSAGPRPECDQRSNNVEYRGFFSFGVKETSQSSGERSKWAEKWDNPLIFTLLSGMRYSSCNCQKAIWEKQKKTKTRDLPPKDWSTSPSGSITNKHVWAKIIVTAAKMKTNKAGSGEPVWY